MSILSYEITQICEKRNLLESSENNFWKTFYNDDFPKNDKKISQ